MTAILFPGQGSQALGMGSAFHEQSDDARARFVEASEILGYDLADVCINGPEAELTRSDRAQCAIFTVSAIAAEALRAAKPETAFSHAAGLSSGEWAALWFAGVVSFEQTIKILQARGQFMQEACEATEGGMLAVIGINDNAVLEGISDQLGIHIANFNSPGQTVLSGSLEGIDAAVPLVKEAGAKIAKKLPVAGAFHSPLMQPAADRFAAFLAEIDFAEPTMPVLSNASGGVHENAASIKSRMAEQITSSVQWVRNVEALVGFGVIEAFECGHGKILTGLVKRIDRSLTVTNVPDPDSLVS